MKLVQKVVFCAAHRLMDTNTVCKYIHGHNYQVWFTVSGPIKDGMIIDFFDLEQLCKEVVGIWDHSAVLRQDDPLCKVLSNYDQKVFKAKENPTCEWMVSELHYMFVSKSRNLGIKLEKIRLKEMDQYEVEVDFV